MQPSRDDAPASTAAFQRPRPPRSRRLLRLWRLIWRAPALLIAALAAWFPLLVLRPFLVRPAPRAWRAVRRSVLRRWGRASLAILGCRVTVRGTAPQSPFLLISNHLSYVDIFLLSAFAPGRFVAKAEIRGWPVAGAMCRTVDIIFVDRRRRRDVTRVGERIAAALADGDPVILFPEGTSTPGHQVEPLKPSLLAPAAEREVPVRWAVVRYETPPDETPAFLSVAWWGEMPLLPHAPDLLRMRRIDAEIEFGDEPVQSADRKALAWLLRERMGRSFRPMVSAEDLAAAGEVHGPVGIPERRQRPGRRG